MAPDTKKRRREPYTVDTKLVEIYEDLANEKDEIRLKAAQALVSQFTPDKNPSDEQIQKALQRLFRGLCSSRKAARIGFSIALTEILTQVFATPREGSEIDVRKVIGIWESQSDASGSDSGQEQRDHFFGRLFGSEAIIKSSILFKSGAPFSEWTKLLDLVIDLAKKKPWIREECGWIIYRCIYDLCSQNVDSKYVEAALERLSSFELVRTPEGVAIWLAAKDLFPKANFPGKAWKHDDPLDARERNQLAKVLKESSVETENENQENKPKSTGVWNSKLHFAWDAVLSRIPAAKESKSKKESSRLSFLDFWTDVVDNGLFASASSEERKYWGFLLFVKVLNESPLQQASLVFTRNLVRCLMNQLAVEDRYLHRMATKSAKIIQTRVSKEPAFAAAAIKGMMGSAGSINFDQVTKTKTVEKIAVEANSDALKEIVPLLEKFVSHPGTDDSKAAASSRQSLANLLVSIVRSRASSQNADDGLQDVLEHILTIFVRSAYFTPKEKEGPQPPMAPQTQEIFRNRINSCLNSLIASQKYAAALPYTVVRKIRDAAKSEEYGKSIINIDGALSDSVKSAFKSLKKLSNQDENAAADSFKLLYSMTLLQVYNGDADAVSMLDELEFCYTKFLGDKKSKKKKGEEDETSDASDTLVEILLSFASKQSQLFRRISEQVFGAFADKVTATGLESLTSILETSENLAGQQEMFDKEDDEGDEEMMDVDDDDDDDDDEEDSDIEVVDAEGGEDDEDDEEDEEDESEDNDDEPDDEEAEFQAKLAAALGPHAASKPDEGSDDEGDMNDDEMEAVDEQLVKVFKARRDALEQKKDKKDAKENMVNFKNRVLDLVEIYVKKCHSSILALDLLLPLLRLTRRTNVKQIANKATNVLREYSKLCKGSAVPSITEDSTESAWALLKDLHREAGHSGPQAHATACSQASLLVVKVLVAHDKKAIEGVVDVYAATRKEQMLSNKCHVQPSFFTDWNNWCVSARNQIKS